MFLVNMRTDNGLNLGFRSGDVVIAAAGAAAHAGISVPVTMNELLADTASGLAGLRRLTRAVASGEVPNDLPGTISYESAQIGPVLRNPGKIICIGLNYRRHAIESGMAIPAEPILFSKFPSALAGHGQDIDVSGLVRLDYEAELGVVIGRTARKVSSARALDYVLGYCNANDLSERELQFRSGQWLLGKTLDGFLPVGPYLRVADDEFDPQNLSIKGWLNGTLKQESNTSDMIFSVAEIIAYISRYITLEPGDLIVTGTPEGVIMGHEDKIWMKPGDRYEVEIEGLGRLSNRLVACHGNSKNV